MARPRPQRSLTLPWERTAAFRDVLTGSRGRIALVMLTGVLGWATWTAATRQDELRETRARIADTHRAIAAFRSDIGRCPRSMNELLHPPLSRARYLREAPVDAWGTPLYVRCPSPSDEGQAEVVSAGPNLTFFEDDSVL